MSEPAPLKLIDFLQHMPTVEIHCHLLGTVRRDTFLALRDKHRAPLSQAEVEAFYVRGEKPQGVLHILRALDEHFLLKRLTSTG